MTGFYRVPTLPFVERQFEPSYKAADDLSHRQSGLVDQEIAIESPDPPKHGDISVTHD